MARAQPFEDLCLLVADYQLEKEEHGRHRGEVAASSPTPAAAPGQRLVRTTHVYQAAG